MARSSRVSIDSEYVPERGDAVWLQFDPQAGHEQAGRRPALVLSDRSYNEKVGLAVVCPITSQVKGYPFEVVIPGGLRAQGAILSDQIKTLDWRVRDAKLLCQLPNAVTADVVAKLAALIGA